MPFNLNIMKKKRLGKSNAGISQIKKLLNCSSFRKVIISNYYLVRIFKQRKIKSESESFSEYLRNKVECNGER